MRKNVSTLTPSEERVGYSRAVRINNRVYFSGTTAMNEKGDTIGKTLYEQTKYCFEKIVSVLEKEQFSKQDVVIITAYVTSIKNLAEFDKAFIEYFYDVKPCCTLVGIKELVKPDLLVEIECVAEKD